MAVDSVHYITVTVFVMCILMYLISKINNDKVFIILSGFLWAMLSIYIGMEGLYNLDNDFLRLSVIIIFSGIGFYLVVRNTYDLIVEAYG